MKHIHVLWRILSMNLMPPICLLLNTLTTVLTINMFNTDPFPCFTSIILLSQVFSTLPVKGQVSEVVSENIYPLHEYKEDTKSSISFLNHGATNCKEKKRLLGQKNSQWCVKKGWGKKENDKYTLWPTFCKSFWKFIFPWLWVTMPSVVSIIDYNQSSITIFRQCDNWLLIDWLLIMKN